jgi:hypothetical protein
MLSYFGQHRLVADTALVRLLMSISAIGATTFLALKEPVRKHGRGENGRNAPGSSHEALAHVPEKACPGLDKGRLPFSAETRPRKERRGRLSAFRVGENGTRSGVHKPKYDFPAAIC